MLSIQTLLAHLPYHYIYQHYTSYLPHLPLYLLPLTSVPLALVAVLALHHTCCSHLLPLIVYLLRRQVLLTFTILYLYAPPTTSLYLYTTYVKVSLPTMYNLLLGSTTSTTPPTVANASPIISVAGALCCCTCSHQ